MKAPSYKNLSPASDQASKNLSRVKSQDTKAERLLRSTLWKQGFRFRKNVKSLPGKPDIVFPTDKLAIFCDGDFWHGRNWNQDKQRLSKGHNAPYWLAKISSNIERDKNHTQTLQSLGWTVIRLWDSDINTNIEKTAQIVSDAINARRASSRPAKTQEAM